MGNHRKDFDLHVKKLYAKINEDIDLGRRPLPDFPGVAARLGELITNPNYRSEELVQVLERDDKLENLILRIASSPLYPAQEPCKELNMAVRRMGVETTSNLVLTYSLHSLFLSNIKQVQLKLTRIWTQDTKVAATAALIGQYASGIKAENALFASLLQNVGTYFILANFGEKIKNDYHWELFDAVIDRYSNKLSVRILEKWHMSDEIIETAATKDQWLRDHPGPADIADVIIAARYHVYLNTSKIKSVPKYTDLPAAKRLKLKKSEATPFQGLKFVHEEREKIADIIRMLAA